MSNISIFEELKDDVVNPTEISQESSLTEINLSQKLSTTNINRINYIKIEDRELLAKKIEKFILSLGTVKTTIDRNSISFYTAESIYTMTKLIPMSEVNKTTKNDSSINLDAIKKILVSNFNIFFENTYIDFYDISEKLSINVTLINNENIIYKILNTIDSIVDINQDTIKDIMQFKQFIKHEEEIIDINKLLLRDDIDITKYTVNSPYLKFLFNFYNSTHNYTSHIDGKKININHINDMLSYLFLNKLYMHENHIFGFLTLILDIYNKLHNDRDLVLKISQSLNNKVEELKSLLNNLYSIKLNLNVNDIFKVNDDEVYKISNKIKTLIDDIDKTCVYIVNLYYLFVNNDNLIKDLQKLINNFKDER